MIPWTTMATLPLLLIYWISINIQYITLLLGPAADIPPSLALVSSNIKVSIMSMCVCVYECSWFHFPLNSWVHPLFRARVLAIDCCSTSCSMCGWERANAVNSTMIHWSQWELATSISSAPAFVDHVPLFCSINPMFAESCLPFS